MQCKKFLKEHILSNYSIKCSAKDADVNYCFLFYYAGPFLLIVE